MPKIKKLNANQLVQYGEKEIQFGTVYLNYCEIGKTVEELAHDNDEYIGKDAFKPFGHYSADFNVAFFDQDLSFKQPDIQQYIDQHHDFFLAHNITSVYNATAQPLRFPVADLQYTGYTQELIKAIAHQHPVRKVDIQ
jgi:spore coat polysaccharide biosynthesis protein SpsF (cytidylyltransferase family)